jgi:hypothetical protein
VSVQRIVLDLRSEEMVLRVLYRSDGRSNPGTKARAREVTDLARSGLRDALEALEGRADVVGVSGYHIREDVLSLSRPDEEALPLLPATTNKRSRSGRGGTS